MYVGYIGCCALACKFMFLGYYDKTDSHCLIVWVQLQRWNQHWMNQGHITVMDGTQPAVGQDRQLDTWTDRHQTDAWHLPLLMLSVHWCCWLGGRKGIQPVKNRVVGCWCGCLGWGADGLRKGHRLPECLVCNREQWAREGPGACKITSILLRRSTGGSSAS